jgi:hypothetical protein
MRALYYWLGRQAEWTAVGLAALMLLAGAASAQTLVEKGESSPEKSQQELPELVTDRPDFTESTEVAGTGVFQFENGVTLEKDRSAGMHRIAGPE